MTETLGLVGTDGASVQDGAAWLTGQSAANFEYLAREVTALAVVDGYEGTAAAFAEDLLAVRNPIGLNPALPNWPEGGWGLDTGYETDCLTTALALLALDATGFNGGFALSNVPLPLGGRNDHEWDIPADATRVNLFVTVTGTTIFVRMTEGSPPSGGFGFSLPPGNYWIAYPDSGLPFTPGHNYIAFDEIGGSAGSYSVTAAYETPTFDTLSLADPLDYLRLAQNPDGGWGLQRGQPTEFYTTLHVTLALQRFANYDLDDEIADAIAYIRSQQFGNGAFGYSGTPISYVTALAIFAMVGAESPPYSLPIENAVTALQAMQQPDGSWAHEPYHTALAVRALWTHSFVRCSDNSECNDGLFCNGLENCNLVSGLCEAGTPPCDDGIGCTVDQCTEATQACTNTPNNALCDNSLFCDGVETCDAVLDCLPGIDPCADNVGCTVDACDEASDTCTFTPDDALCDNGLFCDGPEACDPVQGCQPGQNPCVDNVACTVDACNEANDTCSFTPTDSLCDNGLFCDGAESCDPVQDCQPGQNPCVDGVGCTVDGCNEVANVCVFTPNNAACNNGQFCDGAETCHPTLDCQPGQNPCADTVACTVDTCNETTDACAFTPDNARCDNGLYCDGVETCHALQGCQSGAAPCVDGVACTVDTCDEVSNACIYTPDDGLCDNGLFCDGLETCDSTLDCQPGLAPCTDVVGCTVDACNETNDTCTYTPSNARCDNGLYCDGLETCDAVLDCQTGGFPCDDAVDCTLDACNELTDACVHTPVHARCDNGDFCDGAETCDAQLDCIPGSDPCPNLGCNEGSDTCICDSNDDCNALDDQCNEGLCNLTLGLCERQPSHEGMLCNDGLFCTASETCAGGICTNGLAIDCSALTNQCNTGVCVEAIDACAPDPAPHNGAACSDANACTTNDACSNGACIGTGIDCDDNNPCTIDGCNALSACTHSPVPAGTPCPDAVFCNGYETCQLGQCTPGGEPCTSAALCDEPNNVCLADCNANNVPDGDDLAAGTSGDANGNQIPDECESLDDRSHRGWNSLGIGISLTADQPTYWSAFSGLPASGGIPSFGSLDPGIPSGRLDPEGSGERVLRGYLLAWAVNLTGDEIRWNHLAGGATVINYDLGTAWQYPAYAFQVVNPAIANGAASGSPGQLFLDGVEYDNGFDLLLLDFYATGSQPFTLNGSFIFDTDLTLLPVDVDLRQETDGPVTTKASFTVWNMNETKFTGMDRCITCWDELLLGLYEAPDYFLIENLQTAKGKAQIAGLASQLCDFDFDPGDTCTQKFGGAAPACDPRDVLSQAASLLGVTAKQIAFSAVGPYDAAGMNLVGMGTQSATILADVSGGVPPERPQHGVRVAAGAQSALQVVDDAATTQLPPIALAPSDRTSVSDKGSLLIYPKIELRWDASGTTLIQDTFIDLVNDFPEDVSVQMYYINGDPPIGQ